VDYKELIQFHIDEAKKKMDKSTKESEKLYWKWIINQLILDYRGYERQMTWRRAPIPDIDDFVRRFFSGM